MIRWLASAAVLGSLTGAALTFGPHAAIAVAVCAATVITWFGVKAARTDKRRVRDKARHPSIWVPEGMAEHNCLIYNIEERGRSSFLDHHQGHQVRSAEPDRRYL